RKRYFLMSKQGYVSLVVALCAALGVHAFILFYHAPSPLSIADTKTLEITLLPQISLQQKEAKSAPLVPTTATQKILATQHIRHAKNSVNEQKNITKKHTKEVKSEVKETHKTSTDPILIPQDIQRAILTKITYPKQALRRGWEGQAEFSLEVHQHNIQHVTMLVSTGYQILDRAAQRGIISVESLPLQDGHHLLPVSFRLQ
ncbi:MAG: energy transducer TonB, partial [Ghiorsea sp.]|nr:energy transducer TonB [Ghiorsea sp.]